jgi:hypothetical protein
MEGSARRRIGIWLILGYGELAHLHVRDVIVLQPDAVLSVKEGL